jgi:hypothetical protein
MANGAFAPLFKEPLLIYCLPAAMERIFSALSLFRALP